MSRQLLIVSALFTLSVVAETIRFQTVPQDVIETRLREFAKKNEDRQQGLTRLFEQSGCDQDRLTEQRVKGSRGSNVICTLPGTEGPVIVVSAHFDKVSQGEGVVDNWSGAALLPSLFQSLRSAPRRHTFVFIGFADEEKGLIGSKFYVKRLSRDQTARIRAVVNIDSIGLSATKVWASRADKGLLTALSRIAQALSLPVAAVNVERVGNTDTQAFVNKKIPSIDIHSLTQESWPILHTARDTISAIQLSDYWDTYRLLAGYLVFLDTTLGSEPVASQ